MENEYNFLSFCLKVCQNKHLLGLCLSKSRVLGEDPLLNASLSSWNGGKVWSCSEIWDLLQVDDLHPSCLLRPNYSEIHQVLISTVELHLSSTFPLGSPLLIGEDHTEMGFGRKEPCTMDKIFISSVSFSQLSRFDMEKASDQRMYFWTVWSRSCVKVWCWGKVILLLLSCCLCVCGIVLLKNAWDAHPPQPLPYDDVGGSPQKGGHFTQVYFHPTSFTLSRVLRTQDI